MRKHIITLLLVVMLPLQALATDNFIYGVQIYNRPIDWYWSNFSTKAEGVSVVRKMANLAADARFDIVRGGPEFPNMYTQQKLDSEREMWGLKELLPILAENNLMLDWVITGSNAGVGVSNPPELNMWSELTNIGAGVVNSAAGQPTVFYEIWNEPDLPGAYWQGTCAYYYDTFFPAAFNSIRQADTDSHIINGGLVLGNTATDARDYMRRAVELLNNGTTYMLAIHAHDTLDEFLRLWNEDAYLQSVTPSKIFLNECGFSRGDNYTKAFQSVGKMIAAKRLGLAGIVLFHMGGLTQNMMNDLQDNGYYYSYMTALNANNEPIPNEIYYSAKAAISHTKGLLPVNSWPLTKNDGAYTWLFQNDDGSSKTLVYLNSESGHPSDNDITAAFGSDGYDAVYNLTGDEVSHGTNSTILYYVKTSSTPPAPQVPQAITIITTSADLSGTQGVAFSRQLNADTEGVTWTYTGNFPAGLMPYSNGVISGTPTENGTFTFTATASKEGMTSASKTLTITIAPQQSEPDTYTPSTQQPAITTTTLTSGKYGTRYSFTFSSDSAAGIWTLQGELPTGLTFDGNTGTISGTPQEYGDFTISVHVTADGMNSETATFTLSIALAGQITITTTQADFDATECIVNKSYRVALNSDPAGASWTVINNTLPSGLRLMRLADTDQVCISGTPTVSGYYPFTLRADLYGWEAASREFTIHVAEPSDSDTNTHTDTDTHNDSDTNNPGNSSSGGGCSSSSGIITLLVVLFSACLVSLPHAEHHSRS